MTLSTKDLHITPRMSKTYYLRGTYDTVTYEIITYLL